MTAFETCHRVVIGDARSLPSVADGSVHLVVTSPPYPMIEMWDGVFAALSPAIAETLAAARFDDAFEAMHAELDRAWADLARVLAPGGLACVNIGDATRTAGGDFRLFSNHARIIQGMTRAGLTSLPDILWRKPTNAPNKFMGSGMLPAGAYVTYEHEYVLIFRKGTKRAFESPDAKAARRKSAYFWEERNVWFSDVWSGLTGARQELASGEARERSAAFPFELPWRLVNMFSLYGDTVLDPFAGTGTTMAAALASGRNSIGVEHDPGLRAEIERSLRAAAAAGNERTAMRLDAHRAFVEERRRAEREPGHVNARYGFPVVTGQEVDLELVRTIGVERSGEGTYVATHASSSEEQGSLFGRP